VLAYYPFRYLALKIKIPFVVFLVNKLEKALRWNLFLTFLVSNYAEITLFSIIDFSSFKASSFLSVLSFLLALFLILVGLYFLWKMITVSRDITKNADQDDNSNIVDEKWGAFETLYEPYKNDSFWTQGYLFILSSRIVLCYLIIAVLYRYPIFQSVILSLLSLLSLIYIVIIKPMDETRELIENIVFEFIILMVNVFVIALAVLDEQNGYREKLGTAIVVCNTAARILSTIFVIYALCSKLYELYQDKKDYIQKSAFVVGLKRIMKKIFKPCSKTNKPVSPGSNMVAATDPVFQRRSKKKKSALENTKEILQRLFRPLSPKKRVTPEPYSLDRIPAAAAVQHSKRKQNPTARKRITPALSARRNVHDKPLYLVTDVVTSNDEKNARDDDSQRHDTFGNRNSLRQSLFSDEYLSMGSNKSSPLKKWNGRGSSNFNTPSKEPEPAGMTSHSLIDFSQTANMLLKSEKVKTGSLIFDETEQPLAQSLKRASKSVFSQAASQKTLVQKTLRDRDGYLGSLHLESPSHLNLNFEASSMSSLLHRSPINARGSPYGESQIELLKPPSLLEISSSREVNLDKRHSRTPKRSQPPVLDIIPDIEESPQITPLNYRDKSLDLDKFGHL